MASQLFMYYFSGTGNAKNAVKWIAQVAESKQIQTVIHNIADIDRLHIEPPPENATVLFCSPTHGFNYPPVMIHFLLRFPKSRDNSAVIMNTRAGSKLGKYVTWGLSGIALYLAALILLMKGYKIQALFPVDMPSNWMSIHPAYGEKSIRFIHDKMKIKTQIFAEKILSGRKDFRVIREIIQDVILAPISVLYYMIGRFFFAKSFFASKDCTNCGLCIRECPVKAIIRVHNRPFWTYHCESCMHCMSHCPTRAIETAHGFIIGMLVLFYSVIVGYMYYALNEYLFPVENRLLKFAIDSGVCIILMFIGYRIVHSIMAIRLFERIMVYTSLTKYKFWGKRYKALND